jgi:phospholipid N-methyltransferase
MSTMLAGASVPGGVTGTYSPEDNKLRLYPAARLDSETYARVKAAGFAWAPKQGLFVAPAWSPERADLLEELAGEIGDEDTSLVDRATDRAERFTDYRESRLEDAESARAAVAAIADNLPLGQPILVGHHSERRARKDAERIQNGMRRAVKMWETAAYWKARASGAVRAAKYKEIPSVRARRIKTLEADRRKIERERAEADRWLRLWSNVHDDNAAKKRDGSPTTMLERAQYLANYCGLNVANEGGHRWSAWEVLRPDGERYQGCPAMTPEDVQRIAAERYPRTIARCDRWLAHLDNRLTYERAMLADAGGIATDKVGPEKGGAVRCWAGPRGGWAYIQKVNKVSVSILDNWGNGGGNFKRTIPLDKLAAVMTAAQVNEAREAGRLVETEDKTGFFLADAPPPKAPEPRPAEPDAAAFSAMRETLRAGVQVVAVPQLFPTPAPLAARMVELAAIEPGDRVLEPSAGTGAILSAIGDRGAAIVAAEISGDLARLLAANFPRAAVHAVDFLECADLGAFDRIVMNPPFSRGADIDHVRHALTMLRPGGRLVAIVAGGPRQAEALQPIADMWEELPAGTFPGTDVRAVLLVITGGAE